jgi:hypothetical protein
MKQHFFEFAESSSQIGRNFLAEFGKLVTKWPRSAKTNAGEDIVTNYFCEQ